MTHRLFYCILTLFFGSVTLFLPETKSFPLPRSILQVKIAWLFEPIQQSNNSRYLNLKIEAMPTTIGKKLRSRKVQLACERRQNQYSEKKAYFQKQHLLNVNDPNYSNLQTLEEQKLSKYSHIPQNGSFTDNELKPLKSNWSSFQF